MSDPPRAARRELTTVTPESATFHEGPSVEFVGGLAPATSYEHRGVSFTTLPRPAGRLRCRFATVNDVHLGETEAGRIAGSDLGPIKQAAPGRPPYPEMMSRTVVAELLAAETAAAEASAGASAAEGAGSWAGVFAKGDLTDDGRPAERAAFEACYRRPFGERLHAVRGNHDCYRGQSDYAGDQWVELPGVAVALLDTCVARSPGGTLRPEQIDWLDATVAAANVPVVVMGHHPQWFEGSSDDPGFLLTSAASRALDALFARQSAVVAYTAGHTHRHLVRTAGGGVPSIEVGCVKDFPGTWAEYRVYDGGLLQIVHRASSPSALTWSDECRGLYRDFGVDYTAYGLGRLEHRCFPIALR